MKVVGIAEEHEGDLSFDDISTALGCISAEEIAELNQEVKNEHGMHDDQRPGYVLSKNVKYVMRKINAICDDVHVVDKRWKLLGGENLVVNKAKPKVLRMTKTVSFSDDVYDILANAPGSISRFTNKAVKEYIENTSFEDMLENVPRGKVKKFAQSLSLPIETVNSVKEFIKGLPIENFIYSEAVRKYKGGEE